MIRGITFSNQTFKSKDFALMTRRFFNNNDGIVEGCDITYSSSNIVINKGYFVTDGYYSCIENNEIINASGDGTLVYEIDLSKNNTETDFLQGKFKIITGTVVQEDLFNGGSIYQCPFGNITFSNGTITNFEKTIKVITGDAITSSGGDVSGTLNVSILKQNNKRVNMIYSGTTEPDNSIGENGDIYVKF